MRLDTLLMWLGAAALLVGALLRFAPGLFSWFGNLPGDIRIEGESSKVFIPITSMIVLSVGATIVVNLIAAIFRNR